MKHIKGFTLIELMIVVAVVAILTAVAIPSYKDYIIKGNRAAAQAFMVNVENREKQYLLDVRAYSNVLGSTGLGLTSPDNVDKFYSITIATSSAPPTFTITATPRAATRQANDGNLTLDSTGAKTPASKW